MATPAEERNHGLDLLRIVAMIMIVVLHTLGQGKILAVVSPNSIHYHISWLLEIACFGSVNCFAITSGYVLYNKPFSLLRLINLWLVVVFYTVIITLVMILTEQVPYEKELLYNAIFPITRQQYWYLTGYFGLYLFIPFLNESVKRLSQKNMLKIALCSLVLFCILPCINGKSAIFMWRGYNSTLWLSIMYLIGAYFKKYDFLCTPNFSKNAILFSSMVLVTYFFKILSPFFSKFTYAINYDDNMFISYTSPTIVIAAIALFNLFRRLKIPPFGQSFVNLFAPTVLSVYIIHVNPLIWQTYVESFAILFPTNGPLVFLIKIMTSIFSIWFFCSIIDLIRIDLFRYLKISVLSKKSIYFIEKLLLLVSKKL